MLVAGSRSSPTSRLAITSQTAAAGLTFNGDKAHFDKQGATEIALLACQELGRINSPLAAYLT
jgi:hypothetical protein